jgi:Rrf2 family protein
VVANSRFTVAVHSLCLLAESGEEAVQSDWIAGSVGTNPVVIRRTLSRLEQTGLVHGHKGPRGGYRLARPADAITLGDVYRAMRDEGPLALHAGEPNPRCPVGRCIGGVLGSIYAEAEGALAARLDATTIAELKRRLQSA